MQRYSGMSFIICVFLLAGCSSTTSKKIATAKMHNICPTLKKKPEWYRSARAASKRWGTSPQVLLAMVHKESGFRHNARPVNPSPKKGKKSKYLSSAYGFAQALDGTWNHYKRHTGRHKARRDNFNDSIHFMAWYNHQSISQCKIRKNDAYNLYLAYHEGHGGFNKRTHKKKKGILRYAKEVEAQAKAYQVQLKQCPVTTQKNKRH